MENWGFKGGNPVRLVLGYVEACEREEWVQLLYDDDSKE